MWVVTLHAVHSPFDDGVVLRKAEFSANLQVALKASCWVLPGIDDESPTPPAHCDVLASRAVAGFAPCHPSHLKIRFAVEPAMWAARENSSQVRVALDTGVIANEGSTFNGQRSHYRAIQARAGGKKRDPAAEGEGDPYHSTWYSHAPAGRVRSMVKKSSFSSIFHPAFLKSGLGRGYNHECMSPPISWARLAWLSLLSPFLAGCTVSRADTITLNPVADTSLFEANPSNNLGHCDLIAGTTREGFKSRALLKFDVAGAIPSNAVINGVILTLKEIKQPSAPKGSAFDLRRLSVGWTEGTKGMLGNSSHGSAASVGETSWASRMQGQSAWGAPGGLAGTDFATSPSASEVVSNLTNYVFTNMLADTQDWLNHPDLNFGWMLLTESESTPSTARQFASRERGGADQPSLVITYNLVAQAPILSPPTLVAGQLSFSFSAETNTPYTVETSASLSPAFWQFFRSIPAGSNSAVVIVDSPTHSQGYYRVRTP